MRATLALNGLNNEKKIKANIYLFKVSNRNTRKRYEIFSKLTIKTPERRQRRRRSSSYFGNTCRHFKTSIEEHIKKDKESHIFKHLHPTITCFDSHNSKTIDKANCNFNLKIKEALHINWRKLEKNLNTQQNHFPLKLSLISDSNYRHLLLS